MRGWIGLAAGALATAVPSGCNAEPVSLIASLEKLATANNAEAVYHLGMAYQTGSGVAEDHAKALAAFRRAAALGDPLGAYKLGCYYAGQGEGLVAPDEDEAFRYKMVAAKAGYALAQQDVGLTYGRRGDVAEARRWLEQSAVQGWGDGLFALSAAYNGAFGGEKDPAKTAAYFRLFLDRSEPNETQRAWLSHLETGLSAIDREREAAIIRDYQPRPGSLTVKALSGQRAAAALVDRSR